MMPGNLFRLQLAAAFANRRRHRQQLGIVGLLAMPFVLVEMPARAQAAGVVMVIIFTAFFGAAVGHMRLRTDQRMARLSLLPMSRLTLWLDVVLASMLDRLIPAAIVPAAFAAVNGQGVTATAAVHIAGLLCGSLLLLTVLGIATARLARDNGEVHLFGALACGGIALLGGVPPLPERLSWLDPVAAWNPIGQFVAALTRLADGSAAVTTSQLVSALAVIGAVAAVAAVRWVAGGTTAKTS